MLGVRGMESRVLLGSRCLLNIFVEVQASHWLFEFSGRRASKTRVLSLYGDKRFFQIPRPPVRLERVSFFLLEAFSLSRVIAGHMPPEWP